MDKQVVELAIAMLPDKVPIRWLSREEIKKEWPNANEVRKVRPPEGKIIVETLDGEEVVIDVRQKHEG